MGVAILDEIAENWARYFVSQSCIAFCSKQLVACRVVHGFWYSYYLSVYYQLKKVFLYMRTIVTVIGTFRKLQAAILHFEGCSTCCRKRALC